MIIMYDSIDPTQFAGLSDIGALAGYVDGRFPTYPILKKFVPAGTPLLSIAVFASDDAECLDVETGDATNAQAATWVFRQRKRGIAKPVIYTSAGNVGNLMSSLNSNGIARSEVRIWSAHYGDGPHICGPNTKTTCGLTPFDCDGTQWADNAHGRNLDISHLNDGFFGSPKPPPPPPPTTTNAKETIMLLLEFDATGVCPVAFPNDATRVRLASNMDAKLRIDFADGSAQIPVEIGYGNTNGAAIPSGVRMAVIHRDDTGSNRVCLAIA